MWGLDLAGIADMYESYELANLWSFITNTPEGLRVSFVKAEHSTFRWAGPEQAVISSHGHAVHTLHKSGHWVHADNPDGMHLPLIISSTCVQTSAATAKTIAEIAKTKPQTWRPAKTIEETAKTKPQT